MTPHIEVATMIGEPEDISPQSPLARIGDTLRAAVSEEDLFFLDFNEHISRSVLMHVLQDCCAHGLQFIPVITSARATYAPEILAAAGRDRGVCLRMSAYAFAPSGFALDDEIQELLATAKMQREAADLLLDLGYLQGSLTAYDVRKMLSEITALGAWRSLMLAATTIPPAFTKDDFALDGDTVIPRHEWTLRKAMLAMDMPRMPAFADYVIQGAGRPAKGFLPLPNVRYTAENHTVVLRGHKLARNDTQYGDLCRRLLGRPEYAGRNFSPGDQEIEAAARGLLHLRDQEALRWIGTSHHFQHVTQALAAQ